MSGLLLLPNLGGEEPGWRRVADVPAVRAARMLWGSLFDADTRFLDGAPASPHAEPAFNWLPHGAGALAWWGNAEARAEAARASAAWLGADPAITTAVHDKAFALRRAPPSGPLRGVPLALEPADLEPAHADRALETMRAHMLGWPAWMRAHFCLKPRFGSSGRGRVEGRDGEPDTPQLRGALPRLAAQGGAVLEPWLTRSEDLSVSLHVDGDALPLMLGSLRSLSSRAGVPLGHRGEVNSRGRVFSGSPHDDEARATAAELAAAAASEGYTGPCGVDAFVYRDDAAREYLRGALELNARFTMGIVAVGCVRRLRARIKSELALEPGARAGIVLAPRVAERDWRALGAELAIALPTAGDREPGFGSVLLAAREPGALDPAEGAILES